MGRLGAGKCTFPEKCEKCVFDRKSSSQPSVKSLRGIICQKVKIFVIFKKQKSCKNPLLRFCIRVRRFCSIWEVKIAKVQKVALFALWRSQIVQVALLHTCTTFLLDLGGPKSLFALLEQKVPGAISFCARGPDPLTGRRGSCVH